MTYKTHLIGGLQAGTLLAMHYGGTFREGAILLGASALGSLLPDIDRPSSKIASGDMGTMAASKAISRFVGHRGVTHTIPGAIIFSTLFFFLAMFGSGSENIVAIYTSGITLFIFSAAKYLKRYGMIAAVAAFILAPKIADILTGKDLLQGISYETAILCAAGIFSGCIMHMIYDSFTRRGIKWLWPLSGRRFHLMNIRNGSFSESIFAFIMIILYAGLLIYIFREASVYTLLMRLKYAVLELINF